MNATELKIRATALVNRLNEMGFRKDGKKLVIDQAYELVAAEEGCRNQHVLRAKLSADSTQACPPATPEAERAWVNVVNRMGWDDRSEILHLEGFIRERGLMGELAKYAESVAAAEQSLGTDFADEEPSDDVVAALRTVGYRIISSEFNRPYWEFDGEASIDFDTDTEAWRDAWENAQNRTMELTDFNEDAWLGMDENLRISLVVKQLSNSVDQLRYWADQAFEGYDFGEFLTVVGCSGWEWSYGDALAKRAVFLRDSRRENDDSVRYTFTVEFKDAKVCNLSLSK